LPDLIRERCIGQASSPEGEGAGSGRTPESRHTGGCSGSLLPDGPVASINNNGNLLYRTEETLRYKQASLRHPDIGAHAPGGAVSLRTRADD